MLADGAKIAMIDYRQRHGRWPANNAQASLAAPDGIPGVNTDRVSVDANGRIGVHFNATLPQKANQAIAGKPLGPVQAMQVQDRDRAWSCSLPDIQAKLLPPGCRQP